MGVHWLVRGATGALQKRERLGGPAMRVVIIAIALIAAGFAVFIGVSRTKDAFPGNSNSPEPLHGVVVRAFYMPAHSEDASLLPIGLPECWWVDRQSLLPAFAALPHRHDPAPAYVELHGDRSARGKAGHMGTADRDFIVHDIIQMRLIRPSEQSLYERTRADSRRW
ncbi:MAG: hypothetical protein AAF417_23820 [Pseudomonadota bacterium]